MEIMVKLNIILEYTRNCLLKYEVTITQGNLQ